MRSPDDDDVSDASVARTEWAATTWRPPAVVGRYGIERILGSGGMGQVYRAWDSELQRRVAMKFILGIEPDASARERFMTEARATARIQHPNVVTIYDVDEHDGRPYLVMEHLSGRTLNEIEKPMTWWRALDIGIALSGGLAAAHRRGVLHRDIKPDNAMLTDDAQVKLLDFGLAKLATRLSTPNVRPRTEPEEGSIAGTPGYMAPESWRGLATLRSDVYSLGALLFELCAGRLPYADAALLSVAVQTRDAPLLTDVAPAVDPAFAAIIMRCLARDPEARYASGEELHEALKALERPAWSGPRSAIITSRRSGSRGLEMTAPAGSMAFREIGALVISVLSSEAPTDGDWSAYLELCRTKMAREPIRVLVVTAGGSPTPSQGLALYQILPGEPVPAAVVTDVRDLHGLVTAMGWHNPAIRAFPLGDGAGIYEALRYLGVDDPTAERARVEIETMQREVRSR